MSARQYYDKGMSFKRKGQIALAFNYFNKAIQTDPQFTKARSEIDACLASAWKKAAPQSTPNDQTEVKRFLAKQQECWNAHDITNLMQYYSEDYLNNDGLTKANVESLTKDFWQTYPDATSDSEESAVDIFGDFAIVESSDHSKGTTAKEMSGLGKGDLDSSSKGCLFLHREDGTWRIIGDAIEWEEVFVKFGTAKTLSLDFDSPGRAKPGERITATLSVKLPDGMPGVGSIAVASIVYPQGKMEDKWRGLEGGKVERVINLDDDNKNKLLSATIGATNSTRESLLGIAYVTHRVNTTAQAPILAAEMNSGTVASAATTAGATSQAAAASTTAGESTSPSGTNRPVRDKWALIVGLNKFQDGKIPTLKYAAKDATDFYNFLIKEARFDPSHVRLLLNEKATRTRVISELGTRFLVRVAKPDDLIVLYFSTHGSPARADVGGNNYLIAYDTDPNELYATGIEMQTIVSTIKQRINSNRILLVLDACHSGSTDAQAKEFGAQSNFDAEVISQGSGQLVICSSSPAERSWESSRYSNGVFTRKLLEGFRFKGNATKLGEAFNHILNSVAAEVKEDHGVDQTPVLKSAWDGNELILAAPAAAPQRLPSSVVSGLEPDSSASLLPARASTNLKRVAPANRR